MNVDIRKLPVLFVTLLFCAVTQAENADPSKQLQDKLAKMQQYQADFQQTVTDSSGETVHQATGKLVMARPDKLRWQTLSPDETLLIANGETVWNIDTFVEQVTIIEQSRAVADNPFILLTTKDADTWKSFDVSRVEKQRGSFVITPKKSRGQIEQLTLNFSNDHLSSLTMKDAQEQTSELVFTNIDTDFSPADSVFTPSIPASFMVDDQR